MTDKQLILALRQCEHFKLSGHCEKCEYEMFASCDRRLCAEASLRIEKLLAENTALRYAARSSKRTENVPYLRALVGELRKEIKWKDMVIALAPKKQAEAEADRKALINELCQYCGKYKYAHEGACDGCRWKGEV